MQTRNALYISSEGAVDGNYNGNAMMIADDGSAYNVPPNYASKSRLVEGDRMTLYILYDGTYRYKTVRPAERIRFQARYLGHNRVEDEEGREFLLLPATVTYHRLREDELVCCATSWNSEYAAVEALG